jgi:hypothetical protein
MRARNLKPGFFKNEILGALQPIARLLYEGLWCLADREGRLEDRPTRIKVEVLPYDDCNVDTLLIELTKFKFINRYSVNGDNYIEILNFKKHQNPHIKEGESIIPTPVEHKTNTKRTRCRSGVKSPPSLNPPSLNPESPFLESLFSSFEVFWKEYPKKIGKGYAKKIFLKVKPDEELLKKMIEKIQIFKTTEQWQKDGGQFIPHPATWLNREGWEDEVPQTGVFNPQPGIASFLQKKMEVQSHES